LGGGQVPTQRSGGLAHRCRRDDDGHPECRSGPTGVGLVHQRPSLGSSSQIEQNGQAHRLFPADHLRQHRQVAFNIGPPTPPEWRRRAPHMVSASVATKAGGGKRYASARRSLLHNLSWRSGLVVVRRVEFDLFGPTGGRVLTESAAQRIEDCQALSHQAGGYLAEPVGAVEDCQVCP